MDATAVKILVTGGTLSLALSFVLGFALSRVRMKDPAAPHDALLQCHRVALWESFMLYGLILAVLFSPMRAGWETLAASLLVASAAFQIASSVSNWLGGVRDQFAERPIGYTFAVINAVLATIGLGIVVVGVFQGL